MNDRLAAAIQLPFTYQALGETKQEATKPTQRNANTMSSSSSSAAAAPPGGTCELCFATRGFHRCTVCQNKYKTVEELRQHAVSKEHYAESGHNPRAPPMRVGAGRKSGSGQAAVTDDDDGGADVRLTAWMSQ